MYAFKCLQVESPVESNILCVKIRDSMKDNIQRSDICESRHFDIVSSNFDPFPFHHTRSHCNITGP